MKFHPREKFHLEMESYLTLKSTSIKSRSKNARVDLFMSFGTENEFVRAAIELKFFKRKNFREPNNRYDIFKDISNLEAYKENGIDLNYLFISTDHEHYVNQSKYSEDTKDFDIRKGSSYQSGQVLEYRTAKPYGPPIVLKGNYKFDWSEPTKNIFFTKIEIWIYGKIRLITRNGTLDYRSAIQQLTKSNAQQKETRTSCIW